MEKGGTVLGRFPAQGLGGVGWPSIEAAHSVGEAMRT
jgi:hypothetical protein